MTHMQKYKRDILTINQFVFTNAIQRDPELYKQQLLDKLITHSGRTKAIHMHQLKVKDLLEHLSQYDEYSHFTKYI